ncbi:MAG: VWA domain-containing protein [Acidobacteria bacterium]|nr:VWA domain-containing protein [Acidobacteriota bacterium]MCA1642564.1 VWA domain-containing protein [Acidobacteriota bacterium]
MPIFRRRRFPAAAFVALSLAACAALAAGQAGRRRDAGSRERAALLNVTAARDDGSGAPVRPTEIALYDDGLEQKILSFSPDPSPARIVLLVDNSQTLRTDVPKLAQVAREFAYEIYEGDQMLVVGFDEHAEIISDWTDDPKAVEESLSGLRKKGQPYLFDALTAVVSEALRPLTGSVRKRVIVLIGDGLDRGSKTKFKEALAELQNTDITVYAMQIPDRTGGAFRRDQPKPSEVVRQLAEGTGGRVLPLANPREAAKTICDELRKNRYLLAYAPTSISYVDTRRIYVASDRGVTARSKTAQPPK